jgi:ribosomal protein S18 acetylase RimI-like enzyme
MRNIIRPMTAGDVPIIAHWMMQVPLWQRYRLDEENARRQFQAALQQQDILLVADVDAEKRACGFTWVMPRGGFGRAYLRLIGVQPDYSGAGLGAALLGETEKIVAAHSASLFLLVSDFNTEAQRFYLRHGYRQVGAIPAYVLPDVTELIFHKPLPSA